MVKIYSWILLVMFASIEAKERQNVVEKNDSQIEESAEDRLMKMHFDENVYHVPEIVLGAENAKHTVMTYTSFSCEHCRKLHQTNLREFVKKYVNTGKAKLIMRYYVDGPASFEASSFVVYFSNGDNQLAFELTEIIFDQQENWQRSPNPPLFIRELVAKKMQEVRPKSFDYYREQEEKCLDVSKDPGKRVGASLMLSQQKAERLRITSVPCMIFNPKFDEKGNRIGGLWHEGGLISADQMWYLLSKDDNVNNLNKADDSRNARKAS